jgi:hypothetical protein
VDLVEGKFYYQLSSNKAGEDVPAELQESDQADEDATAIQLASNWSDRIILEYIPQLGHQSATVDCIDCALWFARSARFDLPALAPLSMSSQLGSD